MNFEKKAVLITGGARGIGRSIAERLHAGGANIAVVDVNVDAAKGTAAELSAKGVKCIGFECNVTKTDQCDAAIETTLKEFGKLDILINNAGITQDGLLIRMSDEQWDAVIAINLTGAFKMSRAAAKTMMKARSGAIVNIASVVALIGNPGQANYCSSKAGLLGLTKSTARELAPRGIRVNAVAPGFIQTAMTDKLTEEQRKALAAQIPLGKLGLPADVAATVAFLASDDAAYITGQCISICGGMAMA